MADGPAFICGRPNLRAFVTGMGGFAGSHLAEYLLSHGIDVVGTVHGAWQSLAPELTGRVELHTVDLLNAAAVREVVAAAAPDLVFHLAGQANVPESWRDPEATYQANVLGQLHVLEALAALRPEAKVLVIGSNEEYGPPRPGELPIRETNPLRPSSPYAVSKLTQDFMGYQYFLARRLSCVRARPFNHIGPRQGDGFVAPAFARQVAEAELGLRPPVIQVGNLVAQRDFSDVRDIVRGYYLLLTKGTPGEVYNLGSGRPTAAQAILDHFLSRTTVPMQVEVDPARLRPVDVPLVSCDWSKARTDTGWEPTIPLEQTLDDVLEDWRQRLRRSSDPAKAGRGAPG